jgi:hypothetical protein
MGWKSVSFHTAVQGPLFITRYFQGKAGAKHKSLDIGVPIGRNVYAVYSGRVNEARSYGGYGLNIGISHGVRDGVGLQSHYAHLSEINVEVGEDVTTGQIIGKSGDTGAAKGKPHLHFQMADYEPESNDDWGPNWHSADVKGIDFQDCLAEDLREALEKRFDKRPDEEKSADEYQERRDEEARAEQSDEQAAGAAAQQGAQDAAQDQRADEQAAAGDDQASCQPAGDDQASYPPQSSDDQASYPPQSSDDQASDQPQAGDDQASY